MSSTLLYAYLSYKFFFGVCVNFCWARVRSSIKKNQQKSPKQKIQTRSKRNGPVCVCSVLCASMHIYSCGSIVVVTVTHTHTLYRRRRPLPFSKRRLVSVTSLTVWIDWIYSHIGVVYRARRIACRLRFCLVHLLACMLPYVRIICSYGSLTFQCFAPMSS